MAGGRKGEGFSGTTIKDTWTKLRWGWNQGRVLRMAGLGGVVGGKAENYLNNSKILKMKKRIKKEHK